MRSPREYALQLLEYIDHCPTAFHAVERSVAWLSSAGFEPLREQDKWQLTPGDRRFVIRNGSTIVAFVVGSAPPSEAGFLLVGAHTDSPALKLKPNASHQRFGYQQLGVEKYGGLLLSTWFDRDLGLAGRVVLDRPGADLETQLIHIQRPILRIPTLAIHLNRDVNSKGFLIDEQNHLPPIFGFAQSADEDALRKLLVHEFGRQGLAVKPSEIAAFDLQLVDLQPSSLGGKDEEWVFAPRIDNLASCHAALSSLVEAASQVPMLEPTRVVALWDNEECGSTSMQGARGTLLRGILTRVISARGGNIAEDVDRSLSRSLLVSVDMAHAIHPNYPDRHDREHAPVLGKGPVIKSNANQSYATDAVSSARFVRACRSAGFTPQRFVVRSDLPCGSTIGPIVAALTGIKTVDVGNPMLSMHSIREMAACADHAMLIDAIGHLLRLDEKKRKGRKIRLVS